MNTSQRTSIFLLALLAVSGGCASSDRASDPGPPPEPEASASPPEEQGLVERRVEDLQEANQALDEDAFVPGDPETELAPEPERVAEGDPCKVASPRDEPGLEHFRREVFETVCEAAQWFDGFFGSRRFDEEARRTHGRVGLLLLYDDFEGFDVDGTLKVRVDFPNLENRVNAFLGREDEGDYLSGADNRLDFLPTFFEREGDQDWLLGLGYRRPGSDRGSFDVDVGIEAESPPDPFVRARYRYLWPLDNDAIFRVRPTVYWTNQRGVGYGTRADYERPLGERTLARVAGNLITDDEVDGVEWDTGVTLYHGFSNDRAVSIFAGIEGETGRDVPIEVYGTRVTYRQRMLREWFFGELVGGVTWPKDDPLMQREAAWHFGVGFEIFFSGEDLGIGR